MPIMPTLTPRWNCRAASPLLVKIAVPLPYGLALTSAMASSTVSARSTDSTGPKISSRVDVHLRGHRVDHRRADEEALLVPGHDQPAAVDRDRGALPLPGADQMPSIRSFAARGDHRSHLAGGVAAGRRP